MRQRVNWGRRLTMAAVLCGLIGVFGGLLVELRTIPRLTTIKSAYRPTANLIFDRDGQLLDELQEAAGVRRLEWTPLEQMAPNFVSTVLQSEDRRFFYHPGFDPYAQLRALFAHFWHQSDPGARTVTLQLLALVDAGASPTAMTRLAAAPNPSWKDMWRALAWEVAWNKHDILEAYLNLSDYQRNFQGVAATSFALFDKPPAHLTRSESAVLAVVLNGHSWSPSLSKTNRLGARACRLLERLGAAAECAALGREQLAAIEQGASLRPFLHVARQLAQQLVHTQDIINKNYIIKSTVDHRLQSFVMQHLQSRLRGKKGKLTDDGAVVVIDNRSAEVLAYVGSAQPDSGNDLASSPHLAEYTLQPWLYSRAIDERILTAASPLDDSPISLSTFSAAPAAAAVNSRRRHRSANPGTSLRSALAHHLSIPAVRIAAMVGGENFAQTLQSLGFSEMRTVDVAYSPSLALGEVSVSLLELTNAYRVLTNAGEWSQPRFSPDTLSDQASRPVLSVETAFIMTDLLKQNGTELNGWQAGQIGPGHWSVGTTERYSIGVWMSGSRSADLARAAELWQDVARELHKGHISHPPQPPAGVVRQTVHRAPDYGPSATEEWFIAGTEPVANTTLNESVAPPNPHSHIAYPLEKAQITVSPVKNQGRRVYIQVSAPRPDQNLYLNGTRLGRAQRLQFWEAHVGRFTLELRDSQGQMVDTVHFEVRPSRLVLDY